MSITDRIKHIRKTWGLTQEKFGKRISISTSYLAGIEIGDRKVSERISRLISYEFNVNEHWIKTGEGEIFKNNSNDSQARIIQLFNALSPQSQAYALQQISALLDLERSLTQKLIELENKEYVMKQQRKTVDN